MKNVALAVYAVIFIVINRQMPPVKAIEEKSMCKNIESKSPTLRLKRYLFCDYDTGVRPTPHQNSTMLDLKLLPRFIDFNEHLDTMSVHSLMILKWSDPHLTWNKNDFEGVDQLHVKSSDIWVPDLFLYNSGDSSMDQSGIPDTNCVVSNDGSVACTPIVKYTSYCSGDYQNWPYDKQNCSLYLGSMSHNEEKMKFKIKDWMAMNELMQNREWWLTGMMYGPTVRRNVDCCPNDTYSVLQYQFSLKRHAGFIVIIYVAPAILLTAINIMVLCLEPKSSERMGIAGISFICHLLCIQECFWLLPFNGSTIPNILIFYRDSLIISGYSMFLTAFLRRLQAAATTTSSAPAPVWLSTSVAAILKNRAGQIFLLGTSSPGASAKAEVRPSDGESLIRSDPTTPSDGETTWEYVAAVVERLSFIGVLVTYIVMLSILLPVDN